MNEARNKPESKSKNRSKKRSKEEEVKNCGDERVSIEKKLGKKGKQTMSTYLEPTSLSCLRKEIAGKAEPSGAR